MQRLWEIGDLEEASKYLKKWYFWATHSRLRPMIDVARTIKRCWDGVLLFIRSGVSNGVIEGLINKTKIAMRRAYGFKRLKYLKTVIYLVAGDLPTMDDLLHLPTRS